MTLILTPEDEEELWQESLQHNEAAYWVNGWEEIEKYPKQLGSGYNYWMTLRDGFHLLIRDYELRETIISSEEYPIESVQWLSFFLAGNINTTLHGLRGKVSENAGRNYLACNSELKETEEWFGEQRYIRVQIAFEPTCLFANLGAAELAQLPPELGQIIETGIIKPYYRQGINTPAIQVALQQILQCPYQDLMKRMFLESRVQELIVLQFTQFAEETAAAKAQSSLKLNDIDRIHHARAILLHQLDDPPSLHDLARQAGINHNKLKRGFREVFGTTVFGCLREYRLEKARQLLYNGQLSVTTVANRVGYANTGHFAAAFKRKFGINPRDYQSIKT
jgi:AraC family transcriptional regulator, transcriptional activator of the genes for pyochelin and ferripyochelin receptors